jgi:hypothetical protein
MRAHQIKGETMDKKQNKEGVSVKEIENFAKKHRLEVFFCLAFVFACFFSFVFFGTGWAVVLGSAGGIVGALMSGKVEHMAKKIFYFVFKQEQTTQLVLGAVGLILSIFIPPLIFLALGMHGGKSLHHLAVEIHSSAKK